MRPGNSKGASGIRNDSNRRADTTKRGPPASAATASSTSSRKAHPPKGHEQPTATAATTAMVTHYTGVPMVCTKSMRHQFWTTPTFLNLLVVRSTFIERGGREITQKHGPGFAFRKRPAFRGRKCEHPLKLDFPVGMESRMHCRPLSQKFHSVSSECVHHRGNCFPGRFLFISLSKSNNGAKHSPQSGQNAKSHDPKWRVTKST